MYLTVVSPRSSLLVLVHKATQVTRPSITSRIVNLWVKIELKVVRYNKRVAATISTGPTPTTLTLTSNTTLRGSWRLGWHPCIVSPRPKL